MAINKSLVAEILQQLEDDILSYGWLYWIASDFVSPPTGENIFSSLEGALRHLLKSGQIEVGEAVEVNGRVVIRPWSENLDVSLAKLRQVMYSGDPKVDLELGNSFWIEPRTSNSE